MKVRSSRDVYDQLLLIMFDLARWERKNQRNLRRDGSLSTLEKYFASLKANPDVQRLLNEKELISKRRFLKRKFKGSFHFCILRPANSAQEDKRISAAALADMQEGLNKALPVGLTVTRLGHEPSGTTIKWGHKFDIFEITVHVE